MEVIWSRLEPQRDMGSLAAADITSGRMTLRQNGLQSLSVAICRCGQ